MPQYTQQFENKVAIVTSELALLTELTRLKEISLQLTDLQTVLTKLGNPIYSHNHNVVCKALQAMLGNIRYCCIQRDNYAQVDLGELESVEISKLETSVWGIITAPNNIEARQQAFEQINLQLDRIALIQPELVSRLAAIEKLAQPQTRPIIFSELTEVESVEDNVADSSLGTKPTL